MENKFLNYKGMPLVRKGKTVYFGNMTDKYITRLTILSENNDIAEKIKGMGYAKERIRADAAEPKSNDDLRRLGIGRITPSVKGRDSILNGIAKICEYTITVDPKCVNTIREFSSYVYDDVRADNGLRLPKDRDNHLCDAFRYAFEDVRFFHPEKEDSAKRRHYEEIGAKDLNGGWDI